MRTIRLILCWIYALAAFIFLKTSVPIYLDIPHLFHYVGPWQGVLSIGATLLAPAVALAYGMAWWTILFRRQSARTWALIVSTIQAVLTLIALYPISNVPWQPVLVLLAISAAGFVAFWRREPAGQLEKTPSRILTPGHGTHSFVDKLVWIVGSAAAFGAITEWSHWARNRGLEDHTSLAIYAEIYLISILVLAIHEGGHAIVGELVGMKLLSFVIGPFQWFTRYGKWKFKFHARSLVSFVGFTLVASPKKDTFRERKIVQVAAGPIANLISGLIATTAVFTAPGRAWQQSWYILACFATISMLGCVLSLVPYRIRRCGYSDGAKIYQLLKKGLWADYQRVLSAIYSSQVSPLRPREYEIEIIQRAAAEIAQGQDEMFLHGCTYAYHLDRGDFHKASLALAKAESMCDNEGVKPSAEWHGLFIFGNAFLRRDAARARLWWERLESQNPPHLDEEYWTSRSALLWAENRLEEAKEAWHKADAWAQQLPRVGAGEAERNAVALLRKAPDEPREGFANELLSLNDPSTSPA